jgi:hypothetical protein
MRETRVGGAGAAWARQRGGDVGHLLAPVAGQRRSDPRGGRPCVQDRTCGGQQRAKRRDWETKPQVRGLCGTSWPVSRILCTRRCRAGDHPSRTAVADGLMRSTRELKRAALERSLSDLAPGGVYRAARVTPGAGGLLHRRFTLTERRSTRRSVFCGTVPRVAPGGRYPPPCPVESGLSSTEPQSRRGRPASSSFTQFYGLRHRCYSGAPSTASNAAPMMPASFRNSAGTIGVCRSSKGRYLSAFLLTPPPTTNSSGDSTNSRWA